MEKHLIRSEKFKRGINKKNCVNVV